MFHIKNILNRMMCSSLLASLGFVALLSLAQTNAALAAGGVPPNLGNAVTYSILAGSQVTNTGATIISGNVGIYPGIGSPPHYTGFGTVTFTGGGVVHDADVSAQNAQFDQAAAYTALDLNNPACTVTYAGTQDLVGLSLVPGVYCADSFHLSGTLTLNGTATDTWVFKSASDLIITGTANVISPSCSVWWRVVSTASFDPGSSLKGNILADTSITMANGATLTGKAFARTAEVTLIGSTVSECLSPPTLTLIKTVINNSGGTKIIADFPLFVGSTLVTSGVANTFTPGIYTVSEANASGYTASSWGGDCSAAGNITLANGDNKTCTITNNDNPPLPQSARLTLIKTVINNSGGTKIIADFPLSVGTLRVTSGVANTFTPGIYTVSEANASGYTAS